MNAAGETQPVRGNVSVNHFFQAGLIDWHFTGLKRLDFAQIIIDADDIGAEGKQALAEM